MVINVLTLLLQISLTCQLKLFLQSELIDLPKLWTTWPEKCKPETAWLLKQWLRNVTSGWLSPASFSFSLKIKKKKNPSLKDQIEVDLRRASYPLTWSPGNKPSLCSTQSLFVAGGQGHTQKPLLDYITRCSKNLQPPGARNLQLRHTTECLKPGSKGQESFLREIRVLRSACIY